MNYQESNQTARKRAEVKAEFHVHGKHVHFPTNSGFEERMIEKELENKII